MFVGYDRSVAAVLGVTAAVVVEWVRHSSQFGKYAPEWRARREQVEKLLMLSESAVKRTLRKVKESEVIVIREVPERMSYNGYALHFSVNAKKLEEIKSRGREIMLRDGWLKPPKAKGTKGQKRPSVGSEPEGPHRPSVGGDCGPTKTRSGRRLRIIGGPLTTNSSTSTSYKKNPHTTTAPVATLPTPSAPLRKGNPVGPETNHIESAHPPVPRPPKPGPPRHEASRRRIGASPRQLGTSPRQSGTSPRQLAAAGIADSSSTSHNGETPRSIPSLFKQFEETRSLAALRNLWKAIVTPVYGPVRIVPPSAKDRKNAVDHFMPYLSESGSSLHEFLVWAVARWKRLKVDDLKWAKLDPIPTFERIFALKGKLMPYYLVAREKQCERQENARQQEEQDLRNVEAEQKQIAAERAQTRIYMVVQDIEPDHPLANEITKLIKSGQWAAANWTSCKDLAELPPEQQERLRNEYRRRELAAQRLANIQRYGPGQL